MEATITITVHTAYAHPIGEDAGVFWIASARTPEAARAKIEAEITEAYEEEPNLDDGSEWSFWLSTDEV